MPGHDRPCLRRYIRPHFAWVAVGIALSLSLAVVTVGLAALLGPSLSLLLGSNQETLDIAELFGQSWAPILTSLGVQGQIERHSVLTWMPPVILGAALLRASLAFGQSALWEIFSERLAYILRRDLMDAYLGLAPQLRRRPDVRKAEGNLTALMTSDVRLLREYVVHMLGGLSREALQFCGLFIYCFFLSPTMASVFFLVIVPGLALVQRYSRKIQRRAGKALAEFGDVSEWLQQRFEGIETIKHCRSEPREVKAFEGLAEGLFARQYAAARTKATTAPLLEISGAIALGAVLYLAIFVAKMSGSEAVSFIGAIAFLSQSGQKLARYVNAGREGRAAADRFFGVLALFETSAGKVQRQFVRGSSAILLRGVSFGFDETPLFSQVNATFRSGRISCICGPSGAGKSSLLRLILGLEIPNAGEIHWRNAAGKKADASYLSQQLDVLDMEVLSNLTYPQAPPRPEDVEGELAAFDLLEAVKGLSEGIHTELQTGGAPLSGGQAQRLTLARVAHQGRSVVVVDEATSALDPEQEQLAGQFLRSIADAGAVVIVVAHRPETIAGADDVFVLDHGRLTAQS